MKIAAKVPNSVVVFVCKTERRLPMYRILLIEDTLEMQKLIQNNLSARKYEVITAANGGEGLKMAQESHPDLILLDIRLPDVTGWDVLAALKRDPDLKYIPVIIMTASELTDDSKRAMKMGAACYFPKPFKLHEFIARVGQTLQDNRPAGNN
jgi:DNA-binding response OmpR family regulator